jgi:hypothetical protein
VEEADEVEDDEVEEGVKYEGCVCEGPRREGDESGASIFDFLLDFLYVVVVVLEFVKWAARL